MFVNGLDRLLKEMFSVFLCQFVVLTTVCCWWQPFWKKITGSLCTKCSTWCSMAKSRFGQGWYLWLLKGDLFKAYIWHWEDGRNSIITASASKNAHLLWRYNWYYRWPNNHSFIYQLDLRILLWRRQFVEDCTVTICNNWRKCIG